MYTKTDTYSEILNIRGVDIYLPKVGYGLDADDETISKPVEIIKRSPIPEEQYWER